MNHTYKVLKSDIELFAAALSQVRVYVVKPLSDGMVEVVDYGVLWKNFRLIRSRLTNRISSVSSLNLE